MKKKQIPLRPMSPHEARTLNQLCSLQRDNLNVRSGWVLLNSTGTVVLRNQKAGEQPTGGVEFTRAEFERIAKWYLTPQKRVR